MLIAPAKPASDAAAGPRSTQLRLLPAFSPLLERFGAAFFRRIPEEPGVYLMRDERLRLLYVGKARNLRQRLNSYRYPARVPRKTVRLLHAVRILEWEVCASEPHACLRENHLIRTQRPPFNRLGVWPKAYPFVQLYHLPQAVGLALTRSLAGVEPDALMPELPLCEPAAVPPAQVETFGAFRGGASFAYHALLRLLWDAIHPHAQPHSAPRRLFLERPPRRFEFGAPEAQPWIQPIRAFLNGASAELIERLAASLPPPADAFRNLVQQADLDCLRLFFERGPKRNRDVCRGLGRPASLVRQEEVDDLWVLSSLPAAPSASP